MLSQWIPMRIQNLSRFIFIQDFRVIVILVSSVQSHDKNLLSSLNLRKIVHFLTLKFFSGDFSGFIAEKTAFLCSWSGNHSDAKRKPFLFSVATLIASLQLAKGATFAADVLSEISCKNKAALSCVILCSLLLQK